MKKIGLKKTLLFETTFEVIKIGLYNCRVSHSQSQDICPIIIIFGFVRYVNNCTAYTSHCIMTFWEIRNITEVVEQNHLKRCMCVYVSTSTIPEDFRAI